MRVVRETRWGEGRSYKNNIIAPAVIGTATTATRSTCGGARRVYRAPIYAPDANPIVSPIKCGPDTSPCRAMANPPAALMNTSAIIAVPTVCRSGKR